LHVLERFDPPNPVPSSEDPSDKRDENHRIHEDSEQCVPPWNAIEQIDYAENEGEKPYGDWRNDKPPISPVETLLGEIEGLNDLGMGFQSVRLQTVPAYLRAADRTIGLPPASVFQGP